MDGNVCSHFLDQWWRNVERKQRRSVNLDSVFEDEGPFSPVPSQLTFGLALS